MKLLSVFTATASLLVSHCLIAGPRSNPGLARPDSAVKPTEPTNNLAISYQYMNPVSYRGRTFGVRQWGQMPSVTYSSRSGWHAYGTGYVFNDFQTANYFKTDLGIEKEGTFGAKQQWSYTLGYERWFFNQDDEDNKLLTNFTEAYLAREVADFTFSEGLYYMFGTSHLVQTDVQVNYYIDLLDRPGLSLSVEPAVLAIAANQNALLNGVFISNPKTPTQRQANQLARPFSLVDMEVNLPITLQVNNLKWVIDPHVAKPMNTLPSESARPFFYLTASVTYTINFSRREK